MSENALKHIRKVSSFKELIEFRFSQVVNAVGWRRTLQGDFQELVEKLQTSDALIQVTEKELHALKLSNQGDLARATLLSDLEILTQYGAAPILNIINYYERDEHNTFFPTDVYSWHVDRSPIPADTFLCTYYGSCSEIIANEDAEQKIIVPEIRTQLRQNFTGNDFEFEDYLSDNFFDLHYRAKEKAKVFTCGLGEIWRLAVDHPHAEVLPCIHRAPLEKSAEKRLLLIC